VCPLTHRTEAMRQAGRVMASQQSFKGDDDMPRGPMREETKRKISEARRAMPTARPVPSIELRPQPCPPGADLAVRLNAKIADLQAQLAALCTTRDLLGCA
jgi:hypothetical protein